MLRIFVINGYPQSGKDTFAQFCSEVHPNTHQLWTSTPVKDAFTLLGWKGEKTPEVRKGMSDMMDLSERLFDGPFQYIKKELEKIQTAQPNALVFIHSREPHNIKRYEEAYDAESILVMREKQQELSNHADREVYLYKYDYIIDNHGSLAELREKAHAFVEVYVREGKKL